jgi:hypothetical protein
MQLLGLHTCADGDDLHALALPCTLVRTATQPYQYIHLKKERQATFSWQLMFLS